MIDIVAYEREEDGQRSKHKRERVANTDRVICKHEQGAEDEFAERIVGREACSATTRASEG